MIHARWKMSSSTVCPSPGPLEIRCALCALAVAAVEPSQSPRFFFVNSRKPPFRIVLGDGIHWKVCMSGKVIVCDSEPPNSNYGIKCHGVTAIHGSFKPCWEFRRPSESLASQAPEKYGYSGHPLRNFWHFQVGPRFKRFRSQGLLAHCWFHEPFKISQNNLDEATKWFRSLKWLSHTLERHTLQKSTRSIKSEQAMILKDLGCVCNAVSPFLGDLNHSESLNINARKSRCQVNVLAERAPGQHISSIWCSDDMSH